MSTASTDLETHFTANLTPIETVAAEGKADTEIEALRRAVMQQFDQYVKLNKKIPPEILTSISSIDDPGRLADTIAAHLPLKLENKQAVLDLHDIKSRLENLFGQLEREVDILNVDKKIRGRVKRQMEKNQRDFYLNEQVKAIQKELGEGEEGADMEEIEKKIKAAHMPKEARKKADSELKKLKLMSPMSAEATVVRNYIDVLVGLPWAKKTKIKHDLANAEAVLNEDHYGLEKVKDRILEYLAVQQRVDKVKAPILCLVGPPGVGKTSLGQSVAKATGRKYVRMALGGMRDEAEIRGHRRTYIGAMPGKVLQSLNKVGTRNPLFLLDEIDKLGTDFRGDPSSALLEVLDPEQNHTFGDHYVEVDFDLSDVMFVATSNSMNIPPALLDRMEVIRLAGYTEDEKTNIALRYLLPKQIKNNGVKDEELDLTEAAVRDIVRYYTREAGVRSLEREISKICRKVVKGLLLKKMSGKVVVDAGNLNDFLGVRKFSFGRAEQRNQVGQVVGLAWTEVGGDLLTIEAVTMPGKGVMRSTGSLGDVMKESVEAARTVVRSRARRLGIKDELFEKRDVHIHVPDGATPKDGPECGCCDDHGLRFGADGHPRTQRCGDDRRDHLARRSHGDRRTQGKVVGRFARRHQDGADSGRKRQGPAGHSCERQECAGDRAGEVDRQGTGNRPREAARAAVGRRGSGLGGGSCGAGAPARGAAGCRAGQALMHAPDMVSARCDRGSSKACIAARKAPIICALKRGNSSVGRAQPCQG